MDRTPPDHEAPWRDIIRVVRRETTVPLTYGANWPNYQAVPFWDALDAIGLSAYFPLVTHDRPPTAQEVDATWVRLHHELTNYARAQNRRVVFMKLGYDESRRAAREPWVPGHREIGGAAVQQLCLDRALAAVYLWKGFPGETRHAGYQLQSPALRAVIQARGQPTAPPR